MSPPADREVAEALAALQRLHRHGVLAVEEARQAARLITGDPAYEFPPPAAATPAPAVPASSSDNGNGEPGQTSPS